MKEYLEQITNLTFFEYIKEVDFKPINKMNSMFNYLPIGYEYHSLKKQMKLYEMEMIFHG